MIINIQKNYYQKQDVFRFIGEYADKIQEIVIWEKSNPMPASGFNITNSYEFFIVLGNAPLKSNYTYTKNIITTSVNSNMPKTHKAVMKREVCEWFIDHFTKQGDIVFDPFLGCGTTAVVCKDKSRHFIGCEKVEEYFLIAKERIDADKEEEVNCTHSDEEIAKSFIEDVDAVKDWLEEGNREIYGG